MRGRATLLFSAIFLLTGFSALTLQVVWQRVISLHSGVDLVSFTTVVAAFLGGIGIGSLVGGSLADRLGPRRSILAFAISNLGIAAFAFISTWLFYDVYANFADQLSSTAASFAFNFVILLVPTTLMGLSLPLVARAVVGQIEDAGSTIGRLYSVNTLGAAVGAAVAGWILLGSLGFVATTRLAGGLNLVAALIALTRYRGEAGDTSREPTEPASEEALDAAATPAGFDGEAAGRPTWPWFVLYGMTGAVALGLEVVFFRVVDTIMRSNSYSFAHVLSVYLLMFGTGAAIASVVVKRARRPDLWFLWLQFAVGVAALGGLIFLVRVIPRTGFEEGIREYFLGEGFNIGFDNADGTRNTNLVPVFFGAPLLVMAAPVLCMGASFPFVQALISQRVETLGRRTGLLLFTNIVGNVAGTLFVGFVLIDLAGTAGTYRLLAAVLLVPGVAAALMIGRRRLRVPLAVGAVVLLGASLAVFPSNHRLWSFLHGVTTDDLDLAEDRSCATALRHVGDLRVLTVNGSSQNDYPFDDFHVLIGLAPALIHPDPGDGMALGLGIGATPYGMAQDPRVATIHTVELCGGEVDLLHKLADEGAPELQRFFADPRLTVEVGDGRDFLLTTDGEFDIVTVDTLRPQSAFSGSLYSVEFYEVVADALSDDGLLAQWAPTVRTLNSITEVFPYVVRFTVDSYHSSQFVVASKSPIVVDRDELLERFDELEEGSFSPEMTASLRTFFETAEAECIADGEVEPVGAADVNHDLRPRDEYFLNDTSAVTSRPTCGPPPTP